jgi:predicted dehydrogenase
MKINVGILGYGYWGKNILRNFLNNEMFEVIVVCDLDKEKTKELKNIKHVVDNIPDFFNIVDSEGISSIAIISPSGTHYGLCKGALSHNCNVFIEKPFTVNSSQSKELCHIAKEKNLKILVDHTFLYTHEVQFIKKYYDSGQMGKMLYIDSIRINLGLFRKDDDVIFDLLPHDLSIIKYILQESLYPVSCRKYKICNNSKVDMAYVEFLSKESSCKINANVSWVSPIKIRRMLFAGTKQMVIYDDLDVGKKIKVIGYNTGRNIEEIMAEYRVGDIFVPQIKESEALQSAVIDFGNSIIKNQEPLSNGLFGHNIIKYMEEIYDLH